MIPYVRTENGSKTIPYPAAHTYIAHIWESPPPPPPRAPTQKEFVYKLKQTLSKKIAHFLN